MKANPFWYVWGFKWVVSLWRVGTATLLWLAVCDKSLHCEGKFLWSLATCCMLWSGTHGGPVLMVGPVDMYLSLSWGPVLVVKPVTWRSHIMKRPLNILLYVLMLLYLISAVFPMLCVIHTCVRVCIETSQITWYPPCFCVYIEIQYCRLYTSTCVCV